MPRFDKLLVLDLDETLIHATRDAERVGREPEHELFGYAIWQRPHLEVFLETMFEWFEVGIWTASGSAYAEAVVAWLGVGERLRFLWSRERCTRVFDPETMEVQRVKPLAKLLRARLGARERILFIDDSPHKIRRSYGNYVRVAPFEGDPADDELPALTRYLETLGPVANVRTLEKRGWRARLIG